MPKSPQPCATATHQVSGNCSSHWRTKGMPAPIRAARRPADGEQRTWPAVSAATPSPRDLRRPLSDRQSRRVVHGAPQQGVGRDSREQSQRRGQRRPGRSCAIPSAGPRPHRRAPGSGPPGVPAAADADRQLHRHGGQGDQHVDGRDRGRGRTPHDHEGDHQAQLEEGLLQADRPADGGDRGHASNGWVWCGNSRGSLDGSGPGSSAARCRRTRRRDRRAGSSRRAIAGKPNPPSTKAKCARSAPAPERP